MTRSGTRRRTTRSGSFIAPASQLRPSRSPYRQGPAAVGDGAQEVAGRVPQPASFLLDQLAVDALDIVDPSGARRLGRRSPSVLHGRGQPLGHPMLVWQGLAQAPQEE